MTPESDVEAIEIRLLLEAIHAKYGYDLRDYAQTSMRRRVLAALAKSGLKHLGELQHQLLGDPGLFADVLDDLTVRVTEMFRDPGFYRAFRQRVVPVLRTYPLLKIWHGGCASGEEAYGNAIILEEEGLYDRAQLYATDLNPRALEQARHGLYPADRFALFGENYENSGGKSKLSSYYTEAYAQVALRESLKRNILFFQHNLVSDHVFGEMHVIFCRNVFIYFDRDLRRRVLEKFAQSLCPGGFLCLGAGERLPRASLLPFVLNFVPRSASTAMPARAAAEAQAWRSRDAVVVGGSLGAVEALRELLPQLPADYRLPVIIVLHQYRHNSESFWRLLAEHCALPVSTIEDKAPILPGQIYVAPANYHVLIEPARSFALSIEPPVNFARPAIDVTFESAAHVYGARLVGVLLSGASADGALGLRCIKEAGGAALCQLPSSSVQGTMPRAGCAATAVDRVASPESLGRQLLEFCP